MSRKLLNTLLATTFFLGLAACGDPSKEDIIGKARDIKTRTELQAKLGKPDDIGKLGPIEQWTYKASNGEVVFVITGDTVALQTSSSNATKP
jgi:hypothetical protein